jgi:hypothetical protein
VMIEDWRSSFAARWEGTGNALTFLFVGLPSYVEDLPSTTYDRKIDTSLPLLRLAQRNATVQPHTFQTSLIDHGYLFGHIGSIHPMDKTPVGKRLMLSALEHAYKKEDVVSTGPEPVSATVASGQLVLKFDPKTVGPQGLLLRTSGSVRQQCVAGKSQAYGKPATPIPQSQCGSATGFEVGSAVGGWHAVDSVALTHDKQSLMMQVPAVAAAASGPIQLRYMFADWPTPLVYNSESFLGLNGELPTPPFILPVVIQQYDRTEIIHKVCKTPPRTPVPWPQTS